MQNNLLPIVPEAAPEVQTNALPDLTYDQFMLLGRHIRLELARRYAANKDILNWGKTLFPERFFRGFCGEMHNYFVDIRHEELSSTEAPRDHAKTTIKCVLIPEFQALEEPETFNHYLNVQATGDKALSVNRTIKTDFETNDDLHALYGPLVGERWTDGQFVVRNKDNKKPDVTFSAVGAGQSIRGLNYRSRRPDYIIVDDLYDEEDIENPEGTEKKNAWFWGSLYPARAQKHHSSIHVQGTAINDHDLLNQLKKQDDVKSRTFKRIKDMDAKTVLWPELSNFEKAMSDWRRMGSIIFLREYQNERRDDATSIIKKSYLTNWQYDPDMFFHRLEKEYTTFFVNALILTQDPSIGKEQDDDDTGAALIFKTATPDGDGNEFWIHDLRMERLTLEGRIQQMIEMSKLAPKQHPLTKVLIEAISGFDDYASEAARRTNLPVHRIKWVKDKISTLTSKSHYFENGKVHINKNLPPATIEKIVYQLTTNHPKHDDGRDAVLLAMDASDGIWNWV